jgi:hypothetical protein
MFKSLISYMHTHFEQEGTNHHHFIKILVCKSKKKLV